MKKQIDVAAGGDCGGIFLLGAVAIIICSVINTATAYPFFRNRIPNGLSVPNPGPQGGVWAGVGHLAAGGGGPRNPFGLDFAKQGFQWTKELCEMDSDGDGRSNGVELGDPNCQWKPEEENAGLLPALSHPGIVDEPQMEAPLDSCATFQPPDDVLTIDITFSTPNKLDGKNRTRYICEQRTFESPLSGARQFHQIKTQVINANRNVLHHIWVYTCDNRDSSDGNKVNDGPYSCSGIEANCLIVAGWAVGANDYCEPNNVGAFVDFDATNNANGKVFKIEAHYDNALMEEETDQSGMRIHLTPTLRPLSSNLVILGMDYWDREFLIPHKTQSYSLQNICPTSATMRLPGPIWVYSWNPHMHFYGQSLVTEHYRCGKKIGEIGRIDAFEFDNQQSYVFAQPIKILPGDALVTTCTYNTSGVTSESGLVLGGEETTDEMCDNYLAYYPYVGTTNSPNLFTACSAFNRGLSPRFSSFDDESPFVSLDLGGEIVVNRFDNNPIMNLAPCCSNDDSENACEKQYLAEINNPCGGNNDCKSGSCDEGLCSDNVRPSTDPPTEAPFALSSPPTTTSGSGGFGFCFSGESTVSIEEMGEVKLSNVKIGDRVLVDSKGRYERIYSFGHRNHKDIAEYLQIHVDNDSKMPIEISSNHLILLNKQWVPAGKVQVGDKLVSADGHLVTVIKIKQVMRRGIFAPFTPSGTIVVNGIAASNFVALQEGNGYFKIGGWTTPLSFHWLSHMYQGTHRLVCDMIFETCLNESYDSQGISFWAHISFSFFRWLTSHPISAAIALSILLVVCSFVAILEWAMYIPLMNIICSPIK